MTANEFDAKLEPKLTCGVVVRKADPLKDEFPLDSQVCGLDAVDQIAIADPDDPTHTRISDILLVCSEHSMRLDAGEAFMFRSIHEKFIMVQLNVGGSMPPAPDTPVL